MFLKDNSSFKNNSKIYILTFELALFTLNNTRRFVKSGQLKHKPQRTNSETIRMGRQIECLLGCQMFIILIRQKIMRFRTWCSGVAITIFTERGTYATTTQNSSEAILAIWPSRGVSDCVAAAMAIGFSQTYVSLMLNTSDQLAIWLRPNIYYPRTDVSKAWRHKIKMELRLLSGFS